MQAMSSPLLTAAMATTSLLVLFLLLLSLFLCKLSPRRLHFCFRLRCHRANAVAATVAPFRWCDHPDLATRTVEQGWPAFQFTKAPGTALTFHNLGYCQVGGTVPEKEVLNRHPTTAKLLEIAKFSEAAAFRNPARCCCIGGGATFANKEAFNHHHPCDTAEALEPATFRNLFCCCRVGGRRIASKEAHNRHPPATTSGLPDASLDPVPAPAPALVNNMQTIIRLNPRLSPSSSSSSNPSLNSGLNCSWGGTSKSSEVTTFGNLACWRIGRSIADKETHNHDPATATAASEPDLVLPVEDMQTIQLNPSSGPSSNLSWGGGATKLSEAATFDNHACRHIGGSIANKEAQNYHQSAASSELDLVSTIDGMQTIQFNPSFNPSSNPGYVQVAQSLLPLPGPSLESLSFPQDAYFEIIVNSATTEQDPTPTVSRNSFADSEHARLIGNQALPSEGCLSMAKPNGPTCVPSGTNANASNLAITMNGVMLPLATVERLQIIAVGLAGGGAPSSYFPGTYFGSVGFHSNGHIYGNGEFLKAIASEHTNWGTLPTIVGCGFNPKEKRVYFTLNGEHVCDLTCEAFNEFGSPLYPTVASNCNATVSVNFGQASFEYNPANETRVSDPCFKRETPKPVKLGPFCEDSGELFSMGRIDSQWLIDVCSEEDSEFFEIALDGKS